MSYIRIYPDKNNTIFKSNTGSISQQQGNINTGKNPVLELNDGSGNSRVLLGFNLDNLKNKLAGKTYVCNLKLYDAGVLRSVGLSGLKPINLYYFNNVFVEGDGCEFTSSEAITGVSNWNKRTVNDLWINEFNSPIKTIQLQSKKDDIVFTNIESYVSNSVENNLECNFALNFDSFSTDSSLLTKFIRSRHSGSIFKPYLEIFINDIIIDDRYNLKQNSPSYLYLINWNLSEISNLTVSVTDLQTNESISPIIEYTGNGVHEYSFIPSSSGEYTETWSVNDEIISKSMLVTKPIYDTNQNLYSSLYFYPTTYYNKNIIRKGDLVKVNIVSKNKRQNFVSPFFEYKIVTTSGFEMCPWTSANVYGQEIYFYVDTDYFYEELEYEILVRFKNGERTQTSVDTYKFRVVYDGPTRFDGIEVSP